jgi:hypothetical protein
MMRRRTAIISALILCSVATGAGNAPPVIMESWLNPSYEGEFYKMIVIGISDDKAVRHHFEDKFVSHLRGKGIEGVTSHSLVEDLQKIENRDQILDKIMEQKIDSAISVRVVPLEKGNEEAWHRAWAEGTESEGTLRMLIEETLPVEPSKAKFYGVEIAVWETKNSYRVWSGRSNGHKKKELQEGAGAFIGYTVDALKDAALVR